MGGRQHRLTIIGDVGADIVLGPIAGWPRAGTETVVEHSEMRAGGSAGNAALAVTYLGGAAELLSGVGNDETGRWLGQEFHVAGMHLEVCEAPTTLSVGLIHQDGERTFFTSRGHLEKLSYQQLRPHLRSAPLAGSIALLTGPFLTPCLQAAYPQLFADLKRLGYRIALDTNWPPQGWTSGLRAEVGTWLPHCEHVLLNDLEALSLTEQQDLDSAIGQVGRMLHADATLVVKLGARGAIGVQGGRRCHAAAPETRIFDSIGAGDSFNAGYLLARLDGAELAECLAAGCRAAGAIISRFPRRAIGSGALAGLRAAIAEPLVERA